MNSVETKWMRNLKMSRICTHKPQHQSIAETRVAVGQRPAALQRDTTMRINAQSWGRSLLLASPTASMQCSLCAHLEATG